MLVVRRLQQSDLLGTFRCGVEPLDVFLRRYAKKNQANNLSRTWVAVDEVKVAGYVTIATQSVSAQTLSRVVSDLPGYPAPVLLLARMATDTKYRGQGIGAVLLLEVYRAAVQLTEVSGCVGIFTDAKPDAVQFYAKHGFQIVQEPADPTKTTAMFLPLRVAQERVVAASGAQR